MISWQHFCQDRPGIRRAGDETCRSCPRTLLSGRLPSAQADSDLFRTTIRAAGLPQRKGLPPGCSCFLSCQIDVNTASRGENSGIGLCLDADRAPCHGTVQRHRSHQRASVEACSKVVFVVFPGGGIGQAPVSTTGLPFVATSGGGCFSSRDTSKRRRGNVVTLL